MTAAFLVAGERGCESETLGGVKNFKRKEMQKGRSLPYVLSATNIHASTNLKERWSFQG